MSSIQNNNKIYDFKRKKNRRLKLNLSAAQNEYDHRFYDHLFSLENKFHEIQSNKIFGGLKKFSARMQEKFSRNPLISFRYQKTKNSNIKIIFIW